MSNDNQIADISQMPVAERLALSAAIWASLAELPKFVPVPGWHLDLIAERLIEDDHSTSPRQSWPELRRRIEQKT